MLFGCIADDFTGGSDIASFFAKGGLRTVLYNGVPKEKSNSEVDVCVIALKTRTQNTKEAIDISLEAINWLKRQGAQQFYVKYCSTFDSTPEGNIGPICDAVMDNLGVSYSILCPSLPVNGRTVKDGCLYVNGIPLHESPMKNHPLTPMWDYDLVRLMNAQSKYPSVKLPSFQSEVEVKEFIGQVKKEKDPSPFYIIPDYETDEDGEKLVQSFGNLKLLTGGSGLAEPLARSFERIEEEDKFERSDSKALILSGSCSEMTRIQIEEYQKTGGESYFIDSMKLLSGEETVGKIWSAILEMNGSVLVYSSDTPSNVKRAQEQGKEKIAELLEKTTAELAALAIESGYYKIVVAGGETSGAVTKRLGFAGYHIGESIAPGVPVMIPIHDTRVRLVLKSGNFGQPDFFIKALTLI